jgi:hypothetical protein
MMKKLRLNVDQLEVEGFSTVTPAEDRGTVHGQRTVIEGTCDPSCLPSTCTFDCTGTC